MAKVINIYCDESCHLQHSDSKVMLFGAVYCEDEKSKIFSEKIREIKKKHRIPRLFETKWTKISKRKYDYYADLVEYFFSEPGLHYRCLIVRDKTKLNHDKFNHTHDDFYYKMYYVLLKWIINPRNKYHIYLDIKDTLGGKRTQDLQKYLADCIFDLKRECVSKVQQIRSNESEIIQLSDLITGALSYSSRNLKQSEYKLKITELIKSKLPTNSLMESTSYNYAKFNIFIWDAQK